MHTTDAHGHPATVAHFIKQDTLLWQALLDADFRAQVDAWAARIAADITTPDQDPEWVYAMAALRLCSFESSAKTIAGVQRALRRKLNITTTA